MKQYKEVLLLNSSELELAKCKHQMDMFGIAGHIHTETSGISAMYYLRNVVQLPELVIANLGSGEASIIDFVLELEKFLSREKKQSNIVLLYDSIEKEFKKLPMSTCGYRLLKNPLCIPELVDEIDWVEELLN